MKLEITTTYVEMTSPQSLRLKTIEGKDLSVKRVDIPNPAINHFFFVNVGRPWRWTSRLKWMYEDWQKWLSTEGVSTWIGYAQGAPIGYIEYQEIASDVEIKFFGLLPQYIGMGFGGTLLSEALRIAWGFEPQRVWLHTCTLDHKFALKNYLARGFVVYKKEVAMEEIPEITDPIWSTPHYYQSMAQEYQELSQHSAGDHPETQHLEIP